MSNNAFASGYTKGNYGAFNDQTTKDVQNKNKRKSTASIKSIKRIFGSNYLSFKLSK